jgi:plasmid stability protein
MCSAMMAVMAQGGAVAALNIRNLSAAVKRRVQIRGARHGRSMEAEARAILAEPFVIRRTPAGLFTATHFGTPAMLR